MITVLRVEDIITNGNMFKQIMDKDKDVELYIFTKNPELKNQMDTSIRNNSIDTKRIFDLSNLYPTQEDMLLGNNRPKFKNHYINSILNDSNKCIEIIKLVLNSFYYNKKIIVITSTAEIEAEYPNTLIQFITTKYGFSHVPEQMVLDDINIINNNPIEFNILSKGNILAQEVNMLREKEGKDTKLPTGKELLEYFGEAYNYYITSMNSNNNNMGRFGNDPFNTMESNQEDAFDLLLNHGIDSPVTETMRNMVK